MNLKQRALLDLAEEFNIPPIYSLEQARHVSAIFAVRSDSPEEDTDTKSNAGKFHTELCVQRDELDEAVEKVSFSAGGYFIQEMIEAQFSAVATTRGDELTITLNNGLCEGITSGRVMGITYKFNLKDKVSKVGKQKNAFELIDIDIIEVESKKPFFNEQNVMDMVDQVWRLRSFFNCNVNVEMSYTYGKIYILQCRPFNG